MPGGGGRSRYYFFNKNRREKDSVHSSEAINRDDKKQKNILDFFGGGKRKELSGQRQEQESGKESKRPRKAEKRICEKLDTFRAQAGSVAEGSDVYVAVAPNVDVPIAGNIRGDGDMGASQPTPLEKQACHIKFLLGHVPKKDTLSGD